MLLLRQIGLTQFKNYTNRQFDFDANIIGIFGKNGVGKTNLLDAIHYLCFTRSYFTRQDGNNVLQGRTGFRIQGNFQVQQAAESALCILREIGKKEFLINDTPYERFSDHIGRYPCVIIVPDDAQLITGGSEERRKFIDALLSQLDKSYLQQLIIYGRVLQQRNSFLRSISENPAQDISLLDVLDEQLVVPAELIYKRRSQFMISFLPMVKRVYEEISGQPEDIFLFYESELAQSSFAELLRFNRQRDIAAQRTLSGIHRDELEFRFRQQLFRNIASQGQRKSLLFALKLAELEVLKSEKGFSPLLLLDDVFEKLDEDRIGNLLHKVCMVDEGQVFITDTDKNRLEQHLKELGKPFQLISL